LRPLAVVSDTMHLQVRAFLGLVCLLLSCVFAASAH
jgi:hypothetical protein